jgi:MFS family permease
MASFLSPARITAAGHDRWLVPPCALAVHLCIGMAYGFSVFWLPLGRALVGVPACTGLGEALVSTSCNWRVSDLVWVYTLFFVVLGLAAALWGGWVERAGPRKAGLLAMVCWCGGLALAALAVAQHWLWLLWLGAGVLGGIGLGLGYITPVSTLIKWFPDRRGLATGMAIMGFGGGAMLGSPLADRLMHGFETAGSVGAWQALLVLAGVYAVAMTAGALGFRLPAVVAGPAGGSWRVPLAEVHRTRQFWLVWLVLLLNVSASIGIIGVASPMLQELFGPGLVGAPGVALAALAPAQRDAAAAIGAGFVGLISLFNIGGRFFWAGLSDRLGRRRTWALMLALAALIYGLLLPGPGLGRLALFVAGFALIASAYGGGFATVPAWLADLFGTAEVGAIHGRLLTAWSTAGVLGPLAVAYARDAGLAAGLAPADIYARIFIGLAGLLLLGLLAACAVRPVAAGLQVAHAPAAAMAAPPPATPRWGLRLLAWGLVLAPLGWGAWVTLGKALVLLG